MKTFFYVYLRVFLILFLNFIYLFLERGKGREKERERETSMCACLSPGPHWDLAQNPGMYPDWELNQQPFGLQARAQSSDINQPGPKENFKNKNKI